MTKSLEALIADMKAAAEKATKGCWYADRDFDVCSDGDDFIAETHGKNYPNNAAFIAHASPENVLALIAALERAQQREQEWKAICEAAAIDLDEWTELDKKSGDLICKLADAFIKQGERIAELESLCVNPTREAAPLVINNDFGISDWLEKLEAETGPTDTKNQQLICLLLELKHRRANPMRGVEPLCVKLSDERLVHLADKTGPVSELAEEVSMARELLAYREASKKVFAITTEQEMLHVRHGSNGYIMDACRTADFERKGDTVIPLYIAPYIQISTVPDEFERKREAIKQEMVLGSRTTTHRFRV